MPLTLRAAHGPSNAPASQPFRGLEPGPVLRTDIHDAYLATAVSVDLVFRDGRLGEMTLHISSGE